MSGDVGAVLEAARLAAERAGVAVYLVGGPVRDDLLGIPYTDVDLLCTKATETIAADVAELLGGTVRSYPHFLTWKVFLNDGSVVDVASARRERYDRPGALPAVEAVEGIEEDLGRRDFAVNAIARNLLSGELVDPHGGTDDLENRLVRVLHERSFIDDPTRILRGLRLATRLGFSFESNTEQLLREAVERGAMGTVSRERAWREVLLAMAEPEPVSALNAIAASGALGWLGEVSTRSLAEYVREHRDVDSEVVFAAAAIGDPEALAGSGFSDARRNLVAEIIRRAEAVHAEVLSAGSRRERLEVLANLPGEMLAFIATASPIGALAVADALAERSTNLGFGGNDLELPPGPHIGLALRATRMALFLGEITAEETLAFARRTAFGYLTERSGTSR